MRWATKTTAPETRMNALPQVHLFFGYGERAQYADEEEALSALQPHLKAIQARCGGAVGGPPAWPLHMQLRCLGLSTSNISALTGCQRQRRSAVESP